MMNVSLSQKLDGEGRFFASKNHNKKTSEDDIAALTKFQLDTRVFQLTTTGVKPTNVFNRDQVPMALADSYSTTIDEKNKSVI